MAEALVTFFLEKLGTQLIQEGKLLSGVQDDIEWIKGEFQAMVDFLKEADKRQQRDESIKTWVGEVRNLVYDAEDIIDEFVIQKNLHRWNLIKHLQIRYQANSQITKIRNRVIEVKARRDRYGFPVIQEEAKANRGSLSRGPGAASPFVQEDYIVGIDEDVEQVSKLLLDRKMRRRLVISVFGMGGLGKTTLVKEVYKRIKTNFDCYSWVFVSQSCTVKEVLRSILFGFKASRGEQAIHVMDLMDERQLQEETYHFLQEKKYLLVLDDIWDTKIWEELKYSLPRERGRIIFTTRIKDIASANEDNCHVYDLQPLSYELSWRIFCRKAFPDGGGACPEELKECAEPIVRKCGGLPLAVVVIGGLLSSRHSNLPEWQSILQNLDWELNNNRDLERLNMALLFSYNHLPFYLKYCFLYTGLFPEDYEIGRKRLIRMWVAEGFVKRTPSRIEEEVANDYFMQLIDRSMIQTVTLHARDVVKACKVHDLMRDIATDMLKQEKFGAILTDGESNTERLRRMSVSDNAENLPSNMGKLNLRSFLMFRITELSPSTLKKMLMELKLARVLDLQGVPIESLPDKVGNLIHLRYLDLRGTLLENLPQSVKNLRNLQSLDIRNTKVKSLPPGINMLQQLKHLHLASFHDRDNGFVKMPKGRKCFKDLQSLSGVECDEDLVKELRSFTNLRKLCIGGLTGANIKEFCASLVEMRNLRSLTVISENSLGQFEFEFLSRAPPYLEKLKLQVSMRKLPRWFDSLNCLNSLYLFKNLLKEDPFPILEKLPNLAVLTLASSAFSCKDIQCSAQGFPKLKLLRIVGMENWMTWMPIEEGTMTSLRYLLIADCPKFRQLPEGFQHLTALQDLTLKGMSVSFTYKLKGVDRWKVSHVKEVSILKQVGGEIVQRKFH